MENDNFKIVLDHGLVRLVNFMGSDLDVVRAARVSYDAAWRAGKDAGADAKLIRYLWTHGHTTPFEAVTMTFEVKAPIFVLRQWHRHRTQSYNELSARYKELPEEFYVPDAEKIGTQSTSSKQARALLEDNTELAAKRSEEIVAYQDLCHTAFQVYHSLIQVGWPRELARMCLPLSTYSHMFVTLNLLNLFKFLTLRTHEHAQYEIRQYAMAMVELIQPNVPVCVDAWANIHHE